MNIIVTGGAGFIGSNFIFHTADINIVFEFLRPETATAQWTNMLAFSFAFFFYIFLSLENIPLGDSFLCFLA